MDHTRSRTIKKLSTLIGCIQRATHGSTGGMYEVQLETGSCLSLEHFYETSLFELGGHGGYRWKLVFYHGHPTDEDVRLALVSCNNCEIRARIGWVIESRPFDLPTLVPNAAKAAAPFSIIDRHDIRLSDLRNSLETLRVKVRISDIEEIDCDELRREKKNVKTIRLEILHTDTIREWVENNKFGLAPYPETPHSYVYHDSLLCYWGEGQSLNYRYWLCERLENGNLVVKRCLNAFNLWKCFGNVRADLDGGIPWVTLFREKKKNGEVFQPVDDRSIIVFCKQLVPFDNSVAYLGHLSFQKDKRCVDLFKAIAQTMVCTTYDDETYQFLLTDNGNRFKDITQHNCTLDECGFVSGSTVFIVGPDSDISSLSPETDQSMLRDNINCQHSLENAQDSAYAIRIEGEGERVDTTDSEEAKHTRTNRNLDDDDSAKSVDID